MLHLIIKALIACSVLLVGAEPAMAATYVCQSVDASNACLEWVAEQPLGLPPLTAEQGQSLALKTLLLWATAYVWAKLRDVLNN